MLSRDLSRFSAPFCVRVVRFPMLSIKSWLLALKNLFCSDKAANLSEVADSWVSVAPSLAVALSNSYFVFSCKLSKSEYFFWETQEDKSKPTKPTIIIFFFMSKILVIN